MEQNRDLHKTLYERGIEHTCHEYPDNHSWEYVDSHIVETLKFMEEQLSHA
ncbi:MAG: hypothetical protein JEY99_19960 [Spirochaetales bacterium]|nr:hypothetical protein [Spirochaetales bacterium]